MVKKPRRKRHSNVSASADAELAPLVWPAEALRRDLCVAVGKPDHVVGNGHLSEYLAAGSAAIPAKLYVTGIEILAVEKRNRQRPTGEDRGRRESVISSAESAVPPAGTKWSWS